MNIDSLDLNLLKIFVAIYEERKLTAAGERLGLTQPGISHALKRLRGLFDDELFRRVASGVEPTRRARELYASLCEGYDTLRTAFGELDEFVPETATRTFVLSANDYGCQVVVQRLVQLLARKAPGVGLDVRHFEHGDQFAALQSGDVDLSITVPGDAPSWSVSEELFRETAVGVIDADAPAAKERMTVERFLKHRHIVMSPKGEETWTDRVLREMGRERRIACRMPHFLAVLPSLRDTDALATMPFHLVSPLAAAYRLAMFDLPFETPVHPILQIWHGRRTADPAHRWLRTMVHEATAPLRGEDQASGARSSRGE